MRYPAFMLVLLCSLSVAVIASAGFYNLEQLWRSGKFAQARSKIAEAVQAGDATPEFHWEAATASEAMRDYETAAGFYSQYAAALEGEPGVVRRAREREYNCRWLAAGKDPAAEWIDAANSEVVSLLLKTSGKSGSQRQLALELEYLLGSITGAETDLQEELVQSYPGSDVVLKAAKARLDEISVEQSDQQRLQLITEFLDRFPGNYWRHVAYRYWLYSMWLGKDQQGLRDAAGKYLAEYPNHPESLGVASRYFFEADIDFATGLEYARRSLELYETSIGLDGTSLSLRRVQDETAALPPQPDHQIASRRQQFHDYLGCRFNLARYRVKEGDGDAAMRLVQPVIELEPYGADEDLTLAPFYVVAGQAMELAENNVEACRYYTGAVVCGDSRNRFTFQAAQRLAELDRNLWTADRIEIAQSFVPAELQGVVLPRFEDVTVDSGLNELKNHRVAWGDIDGDGDPDLLLDGELLMGNDRGVRFGNASRGWGISGPAIGGLFADFDNDGDLDILTLGGEGQPDRLLRNDNNKFVDITAVAGNPGDRFSSEGAAWLDYDNDGWLDLYVANYRESENSEGGSMGGAPDRLYRNNAGVFESQELAAMGIVPTFGEDHAGRGVCVADFDNDGDSDIFAGNYRLQENFLWENLGVGGFSASARLHNVAGNSIDGWWGHTFGSCWADVDNDGNLDLFSANLAHPRYSYVSDRSMLLINQGADAEPRFLDMRRESGIKFEETHCGPVFFDVNNDGWLDLYVTSAYPNRRSFLYLNDGRGGFHDVTYLCGARVFNGWGCAWADFDSDGDLDLAVASPDGMRLLRNGLIEEQTLAGSANWLQVVCTGTQTQASQFNSVDSAGQPQVKSNRCGIGSRITVTAGEFSQMREINSGEGSACGNELLAHFGFGGYGGRVDVEVRFTSGLVVRLADVALNQRLTISEADAVMPAPEVQQDDAAEAESPREPEETLERVGEGFLDSLERPH